MANSIRFEEVWIMDNYTNLGMVTKYFSSFIENEKDISIYSNVLFWIYNMILYVF